jgi:hypothetical protein
VLVDILRKYGETNVCKKSIVAQIRINNNYRYIVT